MHARGVDPVDNQWKAVDKHAANLRADYALAAATEMGYYVTLAQRR